MKIAILDDYTSDALSAADWSALNAEIEVFAEPLTGHAALAEAEVLCVMRERSRISAELIKSLPKLRLIMTSGPRNAAIDLAAATAAGVMVCGTESRKMTTSELAMLLLLALARGLLPQAKSLDAGGWQTALGRDLHGLTLGVVGLGRIGAQMAAHGRGFGMEVVAWSQNLSDARCAEIGVARAPSLAALMDQSDAVSIHYVLSERSEGLIGPGALAAMRPDAMLINTSRGPLIDDAALLQALREAPGRKAALDVFDVEPLPAEHPLRARDLIDRGQLLLTPHLGYATQQTWRLFYGQMVEGIAAWKSGAPIRRLA